MIWVLSSSLKQDAAIFQQPRSPPSWGDPAWDNYSRAWTEARLGRYFFQSVMITGVATFLITALGAVAAYALARFQHRWTALLSWLFLIGLVIPVQLAVVPLFFQLRELGLLGNPIGLLFAYVANGLPFAVFILTPFFRHIPAALHEAAVLDGCGEWQAFWRIMLPMARPGLATVAIFQAIGLWKEYFLAFMLLSSGDSELRTLPIALANLAVTAQYRSDYGMLFAAIVLVAAPVLTLYLLLQRHVIGGLTSGAVKG
jgi:ABC-type glycerol-3-phosphate transport system permease component